MFSSFSLSLFFLLRQSSFRFINFYDARNRFYLNDTTINVSRHGCFRDFRWCDSRVHRLLSTGNNKCQSRRNACPDHFLKGNIRTSFTIGTPVHGADKHLPINVKWHEQYLLMSRTTKAMMIFCITLHLSTSLSSYVIASTSFLINILFSYCMYFRHTRIYRIIIYETHIRNYFMVEIFSFFSWRSIVKFFTILKF